jgi:hypothetical protein
MAQNGNGTNGRGRPSKLTPDVVDRLLTAIRQGMYFTSACTYAGIHDATFHYWMAKGRKETSGEYFDFFVAVQQAEAQAELAALTFWRAQFPHDWRAAATMLARRHPDRWAPREQGQSEVVVNIKHTDGDRHKPAKPARPAGSDTGKSGKT